jgi:hypothetical protein
MNSVTVKIRDSAMLVKQGKLKAPYHGIVVVSSYLLKIPKGIINIFYGKTGRGQNLLSLAEDWLSDEDNRWDEVL